MDGAVERTEVAADTRRLLRRLGRADDVVTAAFVLLLAVAAVLRILLTREFPPRGSWATSCTTRSSRSHSPRTASCGSARRLSTLRTLYPVLISPAWHADSVSTAYALTKTLNVLLMTIAAVPFFL